ncbi:MAG: hypothetical protein ACE5R3_04635 [Nitrosopumilaceae archaeon]
MTPLVTSALIGISLILSLSIIPAYAENYEKELMIIFKDVNDRPIKFAECKVSTNNFDYYTITNSFGFATVVLPGNTPTVSAECFYDDSSESECDIILRHGITTIEINVNPDEVSESCS